MLNSARWYNTLVGRTFLILGMTIFIFQIIAISISAYYVGLPLAERGAKDFSSLISNVIQTKNRLTGEKKTEYIESLQSTYEISFYHKSRGTLKKHSADLPYLKYVMSTLEHQTKQTVTLYSSNDKTNTAWLWLKLKDSKQTIIGFKEKRISAKPLFIILPVMIILFLFSLISSILLARHLSRPINRLAEATHSIGNGQYPVPLPETGPQELAQLSCSFNQMAKQVNDLLVHRTTFLAGISHDLRTPLTRMNLALEMLDSESDQELVQHLRTDINEMENLIGQFLGFARGVQTEKIQHQEDVAQLLNEWVFNAQRGGADIELHTKNQSMNILIDTDALYRVFINLLENAIRYSHCKKVDVYLSKNIDGYLIEIKDNGPGIPLDKIEDVFQPFYRLESSRSEVTGGSGLGLSIAKEICIANNWQVNLQPHKEGGLSAKINL